MDLTALSERTLDDPQLLWVDVASNDDRLAEIAAGLGIEEGTTESLAALLPGRASRISRGISASTASSSARTRAGPTDGHPLRRGPNWVLTTHHGDVDLIEAFLEPIKVRPSSGAWKDRCSSR